MPPLLSAMTRTRSSGRANPSTLTPATSGGYVHLASAYALNGQLTEARTALATANKLRPGITIADFYEDWSNPTGNAAATAALERQMDGLRKAGMPEGEPVPAN
jgi:hypothetical protein